MGRDTLIDNSHLAKINRHVKWLFKRKEPFVILKQFKDISNNKTKMFIVLPIREREFPIKKMDLFKPEQLNVVGFPFSNEQIVEHKTLYTGDVGNFIDIGRLLTKIPFTRRVPLAVYTQYKKEEHFILYKDYTKTTQQQKEDFTLVQSGLTVEESVNSIYRLLHTKYVTVISITFNN